MFLKNIYLILLCSSYHISLLKIMLYIDFYVIDARVQNLNMIFSFYMLFK